MKAVLLLLAVLAVAVGPAHALLCHVCTSVTNCEHPQTCPSSFQYCKTTTTLEPLAGDLVKKEGCAESCKPTHSQQGQVSRGTETIRCCEHDLCNERLTSAAPARSLPGATLGLTLALGLALLWGPNL
ncbi:lymphocyte antigen 6D [Tupaia chinensis]|uniref:lymphocyte antigen 6D n=1 Tax=Tupaia chinensis TaxID=246437 RepID=UPI0003C907E9|nr:lymphocyte antigen 6D [Tupaia chinensis]